MKFNDLETTDSLVIDFDTYANEIKNDKDLMEALERLANK